MARNFANANTCTPVTEAILRIWTGSAWLDLFDLDGESRVRKVTFKGDMSTGRGVLTVTVTNHQDWRLANHSLDPGEVSSYNPGGVPLLGAGHFAELWLGKGGTPSTLAFAGSIGEAEMNPSQTYGQADEFDCPIVGVMQAYLLKWVDRDDGLEYKNTYLSIGQERDVCNQILVDYGFAENIVIADTLLNYLVFSYRISDTNLLEAMTRIINATGRVLLERFSTKLAFTSGSTEFIAGETVSGSISGALGKVVSWVVKAGTWGAGTARGLLYMTDTETGPFVSSDVLTGTSGGAAVASGSPVDAFRPTVVDPMRTNTTPDIDLGGDINRLRLRYSESQIRTHLKLVFTDRYTGKDAVVEVKDEVARAKYGVQDPADLTAPRIHRYMRLVEKDGSTTDTMGEGLAEIKMAASDLSVPGVDGEMGCPWLLLGVEVGDLVRADTVSEVDFDLGVQSIEWGFSWDNAYGYTALQGTQNKRVGRRSYWLERGRQDWQGKVTRDLTQFRGGTPLQIERVTAEGAWRDGADGGAVPVVHVSWFGTGDWNVSGYRVRHALAKEKAVGTATSGTTTTMTDTAQDMMEPAEFVGDYLWMLGAGRAGNDQMRRIISNEANSWRVESAFTVPPAPGEAYRVLRKTTAWTLKNADRYPFMQIEGLPEGEFVIAQVAAVPTTTRR